MFFQAYQEVNQDDQGSARSTEREVIGKSIAAMSACDVNPENLLDRVRTIHYVRDVWTYFLKDLALPENEMPNELKASLISIGIFILKHLELMRSQQDVHFDPIIEISQTIKKGLE